MQDLISFMEFVKFKIRGDKFCWDCYGPNAWLFERFDEMSPLHLSAVFDTETKVVYELTCSDYDLDVTVRYVHPEFFDAYQKESEFRMIDAEPEDIRDVDNVETVEEFYRKAIEIIEDSGLTGEEIVLKMVEQGFVNRRNPI